MATPTLHTLVRHLRWAVGPPGDGTLSDTQLLERWAGQGDEAAFELLVWRHGPMVLGTCRRLLRDAHEADDAFQATFLILVRKAASIRRREAVAGWLHRVACRVALEARAARARRESRQRSSVDLLVSAAAEDGNGRELQAALDEEINRLPRHYRGAFVLCCLEGKTQAEAARQLGRPPGTVSAWVSRARQRLRCRLARRGWAPLHGGSRKFAEGAAPALVPAALVSSLVRAATSTAADQAITTGLTGARIAALTEGVLRTMFVSQLKIVVMALVATSVIGVGTVGLIFSPAPPPAQGQEIQPGEPSGIAESLRDSQRQRQETLLRGLKEEEARLKDAQRTTEEQLRKIRARADDVEKRLRQEKDSAIPAAEATVDSGGWRRRAILSGQPSPVWSVAFSPDGKRIATGSGGTLGEAGQVRVWDAVTGKLMSVADEPRSVRWVTFSPDGRLLATAEHDNSARLWESASGKEVRVLTGHTAALDAVAFSPDGKRLATSSWDKTIRVWDSASGKELRVIEGHTGEVYPLAFSPDGRQLVSGGNDKTARVWDAATGKELLTLHGHQGVVHGVAFSPDGKRLATAGWDKLVRLWDVPSGKELMTLTGHTAQVLAVAFSPDGRTLASASGRWGDFNYSPGPGEVILWDVATGKIVAKLGGHTDRIFSIAFSPDGNTLATASWDKTVVLWERSKVAASELSAAPATDRLGQLVGELIKNQKTDEQAIEALCLATLGRLPIAGEKKLLAEHLAKNQDRRQAALEEILHALVHSKEFSTHVESLRTQRPGY
jgi:RNA polymerase sigma factor (sigma-70 family)